MALNDLTFREAVESAMDEFDEIGRRPFLSKYHFGGSRLYLVMRDGKPYDSKAIAGAAFGFQHPDLGPLTSKEFSGGEQGAKAKLEELGFEVVSTEAGGHGEGIPLRDALEGVFVANNNDPKTNGQPTSRRRLRSRCQTQFERSSERIFASFRVNRRLVHSARIG